MTADMVRPTIIVGILLVAASYAATKELQWEAKVPLRSSAQVELVRPAAWQAEALTVQPEQIFQD